MDKDVKDIVTRLVNNAKGRAKDPQKSRGRQEFNLTKEWVIQKMEESNYKCPYTGTDYFFGVGKSWHGRTGHPARPSINRLNPLHGYTQDNCEITSNYYNTALSSWTHRDIRKHVMGMATYFILKRLGLRS